MNCPNCGGDTKVSEVFRDENGIYRVRKCLKCTHRFNTTESVSDSKQFNRIKYDYYKRMGLVNMCTKI